MDVGGRSPHYIQVRLSSLHTQPALTLMEKAAFEDMKAKGLVQRHCAFAGLSLGEYSALAAIGDVLPIESLVDIVFYRGLIMQVAVVCFPLKYF